MAHSSWKWEIKNFFLYAKYDLDMAETKRKRRSRLSRKQCKRLLQEMRDRAPETWKCFLLEYLENCNAPAKVSELADLAKLLRWDIPTGTIRGAFNHGQKNRYGQLLEHFPEAASWRLLPEAETLLEEVLAEERGGSWPC